MINGGNSGHRRKTAGKGEINSTNKGGINKTAVQLQQQR